MTDADVLSRLEMIEDLFLFAMANFSGLSYSGDVNNDWDNCDWWCPRCKEGITGDPFELKHGADCLYGYANAHYMDICYSRRQEAK